MATTADIETTKKLPLFTLVTLVRCRMSGITRSSCFQRYSARWSFRAWTNSSNGVPWGISWKGNNKCWDPGSRRVENVEILGGDDCIQAGGTYLILIHIYLMGMVMNCRKTFKYGDDRMVMNPVVESHTNHSKQQMHKDLLVRETTFFFAPPSPTDPSSCWDHLCS